MKNKSYDYIFGNGKFNTWFNIIVSIISCSAISFCLTELLFSFDFKVSFQKALIFTILFVIFLLLFYYFIKQRTYKLFDQKITYGFRERKILYADIHSLVFTLSSRPKGIYDIGLGEPYLYIKENGKKKYICNITIYLAYPSVIQKRYDINIRNGKPFYEKGKHMQEYYKIYFPYSKEYLLEQIKKTTKPLCISNQAYRDMALAAYKEEDNTLCIGYAAGSMTGGGWEMLQTHIKSYGGDVMLEGTFVLLPYIKKAALFFLLIVILFALFFSQGDLLILTECLILFMFPLYLLYRNISKIGKCEEGRRLVLLYLEKVLHANVEISVEEE